MANESYEALIGFLTAFRKHYSDLTLSQQARFEAELRTALRSGFKGSAYCVKALEFHKDGLHVMVIIREMLKYGAELHGTNLKGADIPPVKKSLTSTASRPAGAVHAIATSNFATEPAQPSSFYEQPSADHIFAVSGPPVEGWNVEAVSNEEFAHGSVIFAITEDNNYVVAQVVCRRCASPHHRVRECPEPPTCYNCGKPGHFKRDCTLPIQKGREGPPPLQAPSNFRFRRRTQPPYQPASGNGNRSSSAGTNNNALALRGPSSQQSQSSSIPARNLHVPRPAFHGAIDGSIDGVVGE